MPRPHLNIFLPNTVNSPCLTKDVQVWTAGRTELFRKLTGTEQIFVENVKNIRALFGHENMINTMFDEKIYVNAAPYTRRDVRVCMDMDMDIGMDMDMGMGMGMGMDMQYARSCPRIPIWLSIANEGGEENEGEAKSQIEK
ncbi:hypothetical protein V9T40_004573 [Parthenolecanium corni]|uniref:Uncharacterized protein n=1 Tax=Parthenolecanium corni TaxID=536013 RepID=A0AAN9TWT2_9HEMI